MAELLYYSLTKEMPPSLEHRRIALSDLLQLQEGRSPDVARSALDAELAAGPPRHRRRRDRTHFSESALCRLEEEFAGNQYPDIVCREQLANELQISEARIQVWFQNRRSRLRRGQKAPAKPPAKPRSRVATPRRTTGGATVAKRPAAESPSSASPPHTGQLQCQGHQNPKLFRPFLEQESSPTHSELSTSSKSEGGDSDVTSFDSLYHLGSTAKKTTTTSTLTSKHAIPALKGLFPYGNPYAYQPLLNPLNGAYFLHPLMGYDTLSLMGSPKLPSPLANRAFMFPSTQATQGKENTPPTDTYMNYPLAASFNASFLPLDRLAFSTSSGSLDLGVDMGTPPRCPSPRAVQGSEGVSSTETLSPGSSACSSPAHIDTVDDETLINVCD